VGITISCWCSDPDSAAWKIDVVHRIAQELGHARWDEAYTLRVARVERAYRKDSRHG